IGGKPISGPGGTTRITEDGRDAHGLLATDSRYQSKGWHAETQLQIKLILRARWQYRLLPCAPGCHGAALPLDKPAVSSFADIRIRGDFLWHRCAEEQATTLEVAKTRTRLFRSFIETSTSFRQIPKTLVSTPRSKLSKSPVVSKTSVSMFPSWSIATCV